MTREEKQKAINALKKSAPIMAMTQQEFSDYIQTINQVMDWLEKEPCDDCISRQQAIDALGECPMVWTDSDAEITAESDWKDTVKMLKSLPSVILQPKTEVLDKVRVEIEKQDKWLVQAGYNAYNVDIAFSSIKRVIAESEGKQWQ